MMIMVYLIMIMAEINTNAATFINTLSRRQYRDRKITDLQGLRWTRRVHHNCLRGRRHRHTCAAAQSVVIKCRQNPPKMVDSWVSLGHQRRRAEIEPPGFHRK
jgi:hypothetical protein